MEISAIEIHLLCKKISESVSDYFVSGIYSMEQGAMIRLNHSSKPEKLVAVSSFANWITTKNLHDSPGNKICFATSSFGESRTTFRRTGGQ